LQQKNHNMYTQQTQKTTIQVKTIETTTSNRPRVLATFVIDVSGSMSGAPLRFAMQGAKVIYDKILWESDRIEILNFADTAFRQLHMKSKRNVDWSREEKGIQSARSGNTALYNAIYKAIMEMPRDSSSSNKTLYSKTVVRVKVIGVKRPLSKKRSLTLRWLRNVKFYDFFYETEISTVDNKRKSTDDSPTRKKQKVDQADDDA
jgi:hypothetical protein